MIRYLNPCKCLKSETHLQNTAICKSRNEESGNGMKGMIRMRGIKMGMQGIGEGMRGIRVGMMEIRAGMMGIRVGMRGIMGGIVEIRVRMQGIRIGMMGMRVGMRKMLGVRVGMWGTGGGNEENKGENLCIGVELTNYNCGEGQETRNCVFLVIV